MGPPRDPPSVPHIPTGDPGGRDLRVPHKRDPRVPPTAPWGTPKSGTPKFSPQSPKDQPRTPKCAPSLKGTRGPGPPETPWDPQPPPPTPVSPPQGFLLLPEPRRFRLRRHQIRVAAGPPGPCGAGGVGRHLGGSGDPPPPSPPEPPRPPRSGSIPACTGPCPASAGPSCSRRRGKVGRGLGGLWGGIWGSSGGQLPHCPS